MPSAPLGANFHAVPLVEITVGERFRKDLGDIDGLVENIRVRGLLEPIVLDRSNNLLAGGRRYEAHLRLGKSHILAHYIDEVDAITAREIELEENIHRKDLDMWESAALVKEIDELKRAKYAGQFKPADRSISSMPTSDVERLEESGTTARMVPAWTQNDTAEYFGVHPATISRKLALANAAELMPELRNEDSEAAAFKKIDRRIEEIERELEFRRLSRTGALDQAGRVILGDAPTVLEEIDDASVDLIIIDPPYGVLEAGGIGRYESGQHWDDDPLEAMQLLRRTAKELKRVLKPEGHMYVFFGIKMFVETKGIFDAAGFDVDVIPLVWVKTTGSVVDWDYRYSNFWEPILFISNRTRRLNFKSSNVFQVASVPSGERVNVAEKPLGLLTQLLEISSQPGDLVLDCFAGSGSTVVAAKQLGRRYIAVEKDEGQWKHIQNRLAACEAGSSSSPDPTPPPADEES